jgi:tyrosinase
MAIRKRASAMTVAEQNRFKNVMTQLINAPSDPNPYGIMVGHHAVMSHNMHGSMGAIGRQRFLPWHRVYLLKMEKMGQAIDPLFFIPYWKWTTNRAIPSWLVSFTPTIKVAGPNITVTRIPGVAASLPTTAQVTGILTNATYTNFTTQLEMGPHNSVHGWVNGTMSSIATAPADPLFWLHHAMIDKIWADWQSTHTGQDPSLSGTDAIMDPWPENANQVKSIATLGYSYGP